MILSIVPRKTKAENGRNSSATPVLFGSGEYTSMRISLLRHHPVLMNRGLERNVGMSLDSKLNA